MSKFEEFTCQMCGTDCKPSAGIILDIDYEFWCFFCGVEYLQQQNKRYRELLKKVFDTLRDYLHVYTNESDLIDSAEYLSKQIYEELEESE